MQLISRLVLSATFYIKLIFPLAVLLQGRRFSHTGSSRVKGFETVDVEDDLGVLIYCGHLFVNASRLGLFVCDYIGFQKCMYVCISVCS